TLLAFSPLFRTGPRPARSGPPCRSRHCPCFPNRSSSTRRSVNWSSGHANGLRRADVGDLRLEHAVAVEYLNPLVARIGDVDVARRFARDPADRVELPLSRAGLSPRLHEVAVLGELRHTVVGSESVAIVDVAGAIERHVGGAVEVVAANARARRARTAAP